MAWVDPRFREKKPKAIKLNKFGEAACDIRDIIPKRRPVGPTPGPSGATLGGRQSVSARPSLTSVSTRRPARPTSSSRPTTARQTAPRPTTARPTSRPGTAAPCPPQPCPPPPCPPPQAQPQARSIPLAPRTGPPLAQPDVSRQVGVSWRTTTGGLRPPSNLRQFRIPTSTPAASVADTCPPGPSSAAPCPPPRSRPPSPPRTRLPSPQRAGPSASTPIDRSAPRTLMPPSGYSSRLKSTFGSQRQKSQKIVLLPGDVNPHETTVITVEPPPARRRAPSSVRFVSTRSVKPAWVGPCPEPEPEPQPSLPQSMLLNFSPPRTGAPRRIPRRGPAPEAPPCEAPCPPAPCPEEQPCPEYPQYEEPCPPPPCEEQYEEPCPAPEEPCAPVPDPNDVWFEQMLYGPQPCPSQRSIASEMSGNLIDISPPPSEMRGFERVCETLPEDLIQWDDPQDPYSPPPAVESPPPQCMDLAGKQDPFSPPTLTQYYARRYILPQERGSHPLFSRAEPFVPKPAPRPEPPCPAPQRAPLVPPPRRSPSPCPGPSRRRSPVLVDRELLVKTVPHNRQVSTVCRDFEDSEEDLGLLPETLMDLDPDFDQPLTGPRLFYAFKKDPLQANFDVNEYTIQQMKNLKERMQQRIAECNLQSTEAFLRPPPQRDLRHQEDLEPARRVARMYQNMYESERFDAPPPPQLSELEENLGDCEDLGDITIGDDLDFDAMDDLDCD